MPFSNYLYDIKADRHSFQMDNIDLSIVNSIRRIILAEIPVVAFYGEDEPTIEILFNSSPLHNEFMIHRIGLIPIHVTEDITEIYNDDDYIFELNVENKEGQSINITTEHITGTYKGNKLSKTDLNKLFPPNIITKHHILITRLRAGEHLHFKAKAIKRTGQLNACFSPVSLSNFYFVQDDDVASTKDNILDKERSYYKNDYGEPTKINFQIESLNGLSYKYLFKKAIDIIIQKLETIIIHLTNKTDITIEDVPNCPNSINFHINNEDDTIGNLIQSLIHNKYIRNSNDECSYIGYICPHPLIHKLIIRITLQNTTNKDDYYNFLITNCKEIIKIMEDIKTDWNNFK